MSNTLLGVFGVGTSPAGSPLLDNIVISRQNSTVHTRVKIITSGKMLEVYEYSKPIYVGQSLVHCKKMEFLSDDEVADILINPEKYGKSNRSEEYKQRTTCRARNKIRRLVQNNFDTNGKLLTLTFRDTDKFDVKSLTDCVCRYQYFIKKVHILYPQVKNVSVPEFQDKNGRGAVHFHLVIDLPFLPIDKLRSLWRYGFVKINQIFLPQFAGAYVSKYLGKYAGDPRFEGHRAFYTSKNLTQPTIRYGDHLLGKIKAIEDRGIKPCFTKTYSSDWCGEITYKTYNLYQSPAQKENNG